MHPAPADRPALEAKITAPRATAFMQWLSSLWRDKGVQVTAVNAEQLQMVLPEAGTVLLHIRSSRELACCILCNSAEMGERLQLSVTECLGEFADEMAWPDGSWDIVWEGQAPRSPAQLHVLRVLGNRAISPLMRRVRLQGEDLRAFAQAGIHVRMLLPNRHGEPGHEPAWPTLFNDGRLQWQSGQPRMARRTYTIRTLNLEERWMDVDVLLHSNPEGAPPGSAWAEQALPGSCVGVLSPGSGLMPSAAHYIMVADACALPAAARMLETSAFEQPPALLLWVANDAERSAFDVSPTLALPTWICSGEPGASLAETDQIMAWLDQQNWQTPDTTLWLAGGLPLTQAARRWAAAKPELAGVRKLIHTYWR